MEKEMISTFVITDCMEKKKCRICFRDEAILPKKYQLGLTLFREKTLNRIGTFRHMTSSVKRALNRVGTCMAYFLG